MPATQGKETVKVTCSICDQYKNVSLYSHVLCKDCCVCPTCNDNKGLKTFTYFCLASEQRMTGVKCSCGAKFKRRSILDDELVQQHRSIPHKICKVCLGDVLKTGSVEEFNGLCELHRRCPRCLCKSVEVRNGKVKCRVCEREWEDKDDFEAYYMLAKDLGLISV